MREESYLQRLETSGTAEAEDEKDGGEEEGSDWLRLLVEFEGEKVEKLH